MSGSETPILIWSPAAREDLLRLRQFIAAHNPKAAGRAAQSLKKAADLIRQHPGIAARLDGRQDRELFVPFGRYGVVIRYRVDANAVVILKIWHGKEDRFTEPDA